MKRTSFTYFICLVKTTLRLCKYLSRVYTALLFNGNYKVANAKNVQ